MAAEVDGLVCARGGMTPADRDAVEVFREFLVETPRAVARGGDPTGEFPDRASFEAWRAKWLPYMLGLAQGPSTPEEWPAYREQIQKASQEEAPPCP